MEENDSAMTMPEEYINMYEKPFDVILESGIKRLVNCLIVKLFS